MERMMRKRMTIIMNLAFLNLIVLLCLGCGSTKSVPGAEDKSIAMKSEKPSSLKNYDKLLGRTRSAGSVRVIVRLNMPFVPDGQLSAQEATDQQARISQMQDQLCEALSAYPIKGIKRFKYTPYIAMEVDSTALRALIDNSLVLSLEEDTPVPPTTR